MAGVARPDRRRDWPRSCRTVRNVRRRPGGRWRRYYGPTLKSFEAVGDAGRGALESDLVDLIGRFNRADDGTMVVPNEYLETVIVRR